MLAVSMLMLGLAATPAAPSQIDAAKVIAATTGSFSNDGTMTRAVLIEDKDNDAADLAIYAANVGDDYVQVAFAHDIAFSGAMFGTQPELRTTKTGALQVYSENTGVGRDKWERTLTLAFRDGHYVVAGLTLSAWDGLDPKGGGTCDVNYLTGKGTANPTRGGHTAVKVAAGGIPVEKWSEDSVPADCQF